MDTIFNNDLKEVYSNLNEELDYFRNKVILITGHAGFLGNLLTNLFIYLNNHVFGSDKCKLILVDSYLIGETPPVGKTDYSLLINQDICLPLDEKLDEFPIIDVIYNCCGVANPKIYKKFPRSTWLGATVGTDNILTLSRYKKTENILLFSSSEVYGHIPDDQTPVKEDYKGNLWTKDSRACYSESKRMLETIADINYRKYNLPIKVVKPFNIYGVGMSINDSRVLPSFIKAALDERLIKIYGEGAEKRTFCYSTDFLTALIKITLYGTNGEHYNAGADAPEISVTELANIVGQITNHRKIETIPPPAGYESQTQRRCPNIEKLRSLGYSPTVDLFDGIKRYYDWSSKNYNQ